MKKRILLLTNIVLPEIAEKIGVTSGNGGGWIIATVNGLKLLNDIDLVYCFCLAKREKFVNGKIENISYYGVPKKTNDSTKYDENLEVDFKEIIENEQPDIVHIFGTEYPQTLAMVKAFNKPSKTIINIQGLVSIYSKHYFADLPSKVINSYTLRDFLKND
jgi:hypothetical protein